MILRIIGIIYLFLNCMVLTTTDSKYIKGMSLFNVIAFSLMLW